MTNSRRLEKINEQIKNLLGAIIHEEISDPAHLISVTRVVTSADLHHARIFVSSYSNLSEIIAELEQKRSQISQKLASQMTTKFTPKISFLPDDSIAYADEISRIIDHAVKNKNN